RIQILISQRIQFNLSASYTKLSVPVNCVTIRLTQCTIGCINSTSGNQLSASVFQRNSVVHTHLLHLASTCRSNGFQLYTSKHVFKLNHTVNVVCCDSIVQREVRNLSTYVAAGWTSRS